MSCPEGLHHSLTRYLAGELSAEIALMHCILHLRDAPAVVARLKQRAGAAPEQSELRELVDLAEGRLRYVQHTAAPVQHGVA